MPLSFFFNETCPCRCGRCRPERERYKAGWAAGEAPPLSLQGGTVRRTQAGDLELPAPIAPRPTNWPPPLHRTRRPSLSDRNRSRGRQIWTDTVSSLGVKERAQHARAVVGVARLHRRASVPGSPTGGAAHHRGRAQLAASSSGHGERRRPRGRDRRAARRLRAPRLGLRAAGACRLPGRRIARQPRPLPAARPA